MPQASLQLDAITALAAALRRSAVACRQRRALLLSGTEAWGLAAADQIGSQLSGQQCLWVTDKALQDKLSLTNREVFKHLGGEMELVVYDAHSGFDADAFGAVTGLIRGGGLLLLLTPPLAQWPEQHDREAERFACNTSAASRFIQRFIAAARQSDAVTIMEQGATVPANEHNHNAQPASRHNEYELYRSSDQAEAVAAIIHVARGHRHRPAVLASDRGRGKSSALGIAAAQLLQNGLKRIIVTGPRLDAVTPVFQHAQRLMPGCHQSRGRIELDDARLEFMAPDALIATHPNADLLLVDEAATIPTPMLETLLTHHARIVFATTVHGYEGTGRGFALRFNKILDDKTPGWHQLRLQQPIRWAANDPLEQFVFDALLLNATIAAETELDGLAADTCHIERIRREQLMHDEALLSQLFGLLVLAHYRTRPNDLRQLLDSPGLQIYIARREQQIVAVALLIDEGDLDQALGNPIYQGKRRLHGHLLPQSLAFHAGLIEAPSLRYLRLMRIAVHPAVQGRGLGSRLIKAIAAEIDGQRYDCLGTSFGVTVELLRFWQRLGFVPARLGLTREHSSGTHSLIMLRPSSATGEQFTHQAQQRMQQQLPALLSDPLRDFDPALAGLLLQGRAPDSTDIELYEWQDIISFADANRGYEFCMAALGKLAHQAVADKTLMHQLTTQQQQLLISRVIQKQAWPAVVKACGLSGRGEAVKLLRATMGQLVAHCCAETTRQQIKDLIDL